MNVRSKLAKLERLTGKLGCQICYGRPELIVLEKVGVSEPNSTPCAACGNSRAVIVYTGVPRNPDDE